MRVLSALLVATSFMPALGSQMPSGTAQVSAANCHPVFAGTPLPGRQAGTERWIVHFATRSFDLTALEAEYHGAKDPTRVTALCADLQTKMRADQATFVASVEKLGAVVCLQYWLVNACVIEIAPQSLPAVRALPNVRYLQPDVAVVPQIKDSTNSANHDADAVQAAGYSGFGVTCAILDTGQDENMANTNKPHITYSVLGNGSVTRLIANKQIGVMPADDTNGHGTGVASIAAGWKWYNAAADSGHAYQAGIVGYAIADTSSGSSSLATMAAAYQAATADAATYKIVTTNLSYGGSPNPASVEQIAMDLAANTADLLNCTAAGNSGGITTLSLLNLNGLSVGACDNGGVKTVAAFSTRGMINGNMPFPAICANGVNTVMAQRDDETLNSVGSGSSLASPQVCGAATVLRARFPAIQSQEIRAILLAACLPSPGTGPNQVSTGPGCGYLHDPSAHALAATGQYGSNRFAGPGLLTIPMSVQAGKAYQVALVWPRADPNNPNWSNLDLEVLDGTQVVTSSKNPVSTLEFCRFYATKTTTLSIVARTVSLSASKQPFSWAWGEATPAFQAGSHTTFGQGCTGTGRPSIPGQVVPSANATTMGTGNSSMPYGYENSRYQQLFLNGEIAPATLLGMSLRQSGTAFGVTGGAQSVQIWLGYSPFGLATLTTTFDNNWVLGTKKLVFDGVLDLPTLSGTNSNPASFATDVHFHAPFVHTAPANTNLMIEVVNTSSTSVPQPFDLTVGANTTQLYAFSANATTGLLSPNWGLVHRFHTPGSPGAVPLLTTKSPPEIGKPFTPLLLRARSNTAAVYIVGVSNTLWGNISLPMPILPPCNLLVSLDVQLNLSTDAFGFGALSFVIPNSKALIGMQFYDQCWVYDPPANALLFVASNGGVAKIGGQP